MYVSKKTVLILISVMALLLTSAGVYAATQNDNTNTIYACENKNGSIRIISETATCDGKNETKLSWNVVGPKGDKGDPGQTGPVGPQGAQGETGATGATGAVGPVGPQGQQGDPGPTGAQGLKGDKGDKGDIGPAGAAGPAGPAGATGATGATGPAGVQGPKGDKGDKGDTGAAGPAGATGATGATGPQGPAGPNSKKIVAGYVQANGSVAAGSGYTVSHTADSTVYTVSWAQWTFPGGTHAIPIAQSWSPVTITNYWSGTDGAGAFTVDVGNADTAFWFHIIED